MCSWTKFIYVYEQHTFVELFEIFKIGALML